MTKVKDFTLHINISPKITKSTLIQLKKLSQIDFVWGCVILGRRRFEKEALKIIIKLIRFNNNTISLAILSQ